MKKVRNCGNCLTSWHPIYTKKRKTHKCRNLQSVYFDKVVKPRKCCCEQHEFRELPF